jgi:transposase
MGGEQMKREVIRREAVKLKLRGKTSKQIIEEIKIRFNFSLTRMTLYRWVNRVLRTDWNFKDISQKPHKIHYKFSNENKILVIDCRKKQGYSANKIRVHLKEKGIFMSESTIKLIIKWSAPLKCDTKNRWVSFLYFCHNLLFKFFWWNITN